MALEPGRGRSGRLRPDAQHLPEHLGRALHLFERADGDAYVALLVGREVAGHEDSRRAAGVAEALGRLLDVDEDEVGLGVRGGEAGLGEPVDREAARLGVARLLTVQARL